MRWDLQKFDNFLTVYRNPCMDYNKNNFLNENYQILNKTTAVINKKPSKRQASFGNRTVGWFNSWGRISKHVT